MNQPTINQECMRILKEFTKGKITRAEMDKQLRAIDLSKFPEIPEPEKKDNIPT